MKSLIKVLFGALIVASCTPKDLCKDVVCGTGGTCTEGICICSTGYEKDVNNQCNVEWSAKFVGSNVNQTETITGANAGQWSNTVTIEGKDEKTLKTIGFSGYIGNVVEMNVTSSSDLTINYTDANSRTFTGTGSITGKVISINYVLDFGTGGAKDTSATIITLP